MVRTKRWCFGKRNKRKEEGDEDYGGYMQRWKKSRTKRFQSNPFVLYLPWKEEASVREEVTEPTIENPKSVFDKDFRGHIQIGDSSGGDIGLRKKGFKLIEKDFEEPIETSSNVGKVSESSNEITFSEHVINSSNEFHIGKTIEYEDPIGVALCVTNVLKDLSHITEVTNNVVDLNVTNHLESFETNTMNEGVNVLEENIVENIVFERKAIKAERKARREVEKEAEEKAAKKRERKAEKKRKRETGKKVEKERAKTSNPIGDDSWCIDDEITESKEEDVVQILKKKKAAGKLKINETWTRVNNKRIPKNVAPVSTEVVALNSRDEKAKWKFIYK
ncbi:hypothetical protein LIER_37786 [Lithospermum erythrorhizon]|uniref:Uncharacterized protein n=1 Tax=Lithospermum erythrorhizon TaxID=34254 RepID=A0AAV3PR59_LITER